MIEAQAAILVAGRADADHRHFGVFDDVRRARSSRCDAAIDQVLQARLDDGALAAVDAVDLRPIDIDAEDIVARRPPGRPPRRIQRTRARRC